MSVRSFIVSVLAVLWLWPAVAYGQSPALVDAYKRFTELYTQGRYQQALSFAEKSLKLAPILAADVVGYRRAAE
jgi:tetratricopeptide (TPR) repeat protein